MSKHESGQATVEFALCLPFVVLLMAVVLEIGMLGADQIRLWNAAREAVRIAAVDPNEEDVREAAGASGLDPLEVEVTPPGPNRTQGGDVTVRLTHRPPGHVPIARALVPSLTLKAEATMRVEQP